MIILPTQVNQAADHLISRLSGQVVCWLTWCQQVESLIESSRIELGNEVPGKRGFGQLRSPSWHSNLISQKKICEAGESRPWLSSKRLTDNQCQCLTAGQGRSGRRSRI